MVFNVKISAILASYSVFLGLSHVNMLSNFWLIFACLSSSCPSNSQISLKKRKCPCLALKIVESWVLEAHPCPTLYPTFSGFPGGLEGKESTCQYRIPRLNPWVGKIPWREEWANQFKYPCLENSMDRGAWWATVHEFAFLVTWKNLSCLHHYRFSKSKVSPTTPILSIASL